jgi:hypothetical protein
MESSGGREITENELKPNSFRFNQGRKEYRQPLKDWPTRRGADMSEHIETSGPLVRWSGDKASWYFIVLTGDVVGEIHYAAMGRTGGFGSVKVRATIGGTRWETSLFPDRKAGGFVLPVKAAVRKAESLNEGDRVTLSLRI